MLALAQALCAHPHPAVRAQSEGDDTVDVMSLVFGEPGVSIVIVLAATALAYLGCLAVITLRTRSTSTPLRRGFRAAVCAVLGLVLLLVTFTIGIAARASVHDEGATFVSWGPAIGALLVAVGFALGIWAHRNATLKDTGTVTSARRESRVVAFASAIPVVIAVFLPVSYFVVAVAAVPVWLVGTIGAASRTRRSLASVTA